MKIGFGAPVSGAWATPGNLAAFAARAEQAGYDSLWAFQRLLVPVGSAMEPVYYSVLDPMVALQRAGRLADGWVTSSRADLSRIKEGIEVVRSAAQDAGRDPGAIRIICRGVVRTGAQAPGDGGRRLLSGSYEQIRADTAWLAD